MVAEELNSLQYHVQDKKNHRQTLHQFQRQINFLRFGIHIYVNFLIFFRNIYIASLTNKTHYLLNFNLPNFIKFSFVNTNFHNKKKGK